MQQPNTPISFRLTANEVALLEAHAREFGLRSPSLAARKIIVEHLSDQAESPIVARLRELAGELAEAIRVAIGGEIVSELWQGQRNYGILVRAGEPFRSGPAAIEQLPLTLPSGMVALIALVLGFVVGIPFQNSTLGYDLGGPFNYVTANYLHGADLAYYVGGAVAFLIYWFGARSAVRSS